MRTSRGHEPASVPELGAPLIGRDGLLYGAGWDPDGTYLVSPTGKAVDTGFDGRMFDTPTPGANGRLIVASDQGLFTYAP